MANEKITDMTAIAAFADTMQIPIVDDTVAEALQNKKFTIAQLKTILVDFTISGFLNIGIPTSLNLVGGSVTATQTRHRIVSETGATDNLDEILGGAEGTILIIQPTSGDTITARDGIVNLVLAGDFAMDSGDDKLALLQDGAGNWAELFRSNNS